MSIIIGIDHGYYAIKTAHCSFPAGLTSYGEHEPYTRQGLLEFGGCFFVCGSGRQPIQRDKTINDNYYLLTLAAIAKEIRQRGLPPECSVRIAAGLPLTSFGRDKPKFKDYLLRSNQPVNYKFEGVEYSITIEEVAIFPQGYAALMTEVGLLQDEPSMLLMDLGGWTVDLMRIDNAIPAADTAHSLELGMIRCVDDIREQVRRETGLSLTDAQIENMLAGQPCTVSDTVRDIVNKQGRKYTEHLLSATMEQKEKTKMSSKSKTLSAVGYASADIFLQVIRENMTSKMVAEAQELSKNTDGLALVYTISREDIDGAGVWREEKVYQYRNSDGGKCILMIGSGGEHTVWHIATADGYQPGSGCLLMTVQESLFYKTTVLKLRTDDPFIWG